MTQPQLCYLGVGGNLGHPLSLFDEAIQRLLANPMTVSLRESRRYRSEPIESSGPDYVNSVIEIRWAGDAESLLQVCLAVETALGRVRSYRNAPRLLDLDVLLFGQEEIATQHLTVPHPRMHQRRFVLQPLSNLNPELQIPGKGKVCDLLNLVLDQEVEPLN